MKVVAMKAAVACFLPTALALATFTKKDNCDPVCGNMSVPFPVGLGESCARNSDFVLICNHTFSPPKLFFDYEILMFDISVVNGTISIDIYMSYDCYDQSGNLFDESYPDTSFTMSKDGLYTFWTPGTSSQSLAATPQPLSRTLLGISGVDAPIAVRTSTSQPAALALASGAIRRQSPRASGPSIYP
ncbi:hypothetical protein ACJRO7_023779 [Eucalyptus globulus]|uniref:Wall-associated receptor kinase galacturonan-binding domain-containing protein n=1 Tax=Eucalyptus globulus TaxID=34317 RepID=A0ABD3K9W9_EUCGL